MVSISDRGATILGSCILVGLLGLGISLGKGAVYYRLLERTVSVKGLSEREYPANIVIWPVQFSNAANSLPELYALLKKDAAAVVNFLKEQNISAEEFEVMPPEVVDKVAQNYGKTTGIQYRYAATQIVNVYSSKIETVRNAIKNLTSLGETGVALTGRSYETKPQYLFTRLNDVKPEMIEEATQNARKAADKFAEDAGSEIGSIKSASQGQFSINDRDQSTPHIKKVRVVSTIRYYLE